MQQIQSLPSLPPRPADAHKGTFGTVIIVGGCQTMIGAPALTARGALRAGAGLVKIAAPPDILLHILGLESGATGIELNRDAHHFIKQLQTVDPKERAILALGPGLGMQTHLTEFIDLLTQGQRTLVLDADGLNLLALLTQRSNHRFQAPQAKLILTPHLGEFQRLAQAAGLPQDQLDPANPDQRPQVAAKLAQAYSATVVLKGQHTVVTDGQSYYVNQTGNPALATAGTGDVLTGIIAALLAQAMQPLQAAILATHLHGLAADHWAKKRGQAGMKATELADILPTVIKGYDTPASPV